MNPEEEVSLNVLSEPLSISDLIVNGSKFEINANFDDEEFISDIFDEINPGSDSEDDTRVDNAKLVSPWQHSFEELRLQMTKLNDFMHKKITKVGNNEKGTVPDIARVCIRYNAYWEGEGAPFDSSFLRGSSHSFYTGRGDVLEGLEEAVKSMHKGEEAQFLISYQLLFREMGCPPRVKPKADGLFIIECVDFNAVGDMNATDELSDENRNKFPAVVIKAKEVHLKGIDFFGQSMYKNACKAFMKAVNALNFCQLKNEEEQEQQTAFLIKLHTNLAVCYNKLNQFNKAILMCREIRRLANDKMSCKALFQEGRALLMLGEFTRARTLLIRAQNIEPNNVDVNKELKTLEMRYSNYKNNERELWTRAISVIKRDENKMNRTAENDTDSSFREGMSNVIQSLNKTENFKSFELPTGLTSKEINVVDELAKEMNMKLQLSPLDNTTYTLVKK
ncbi:inactive peptidyl-prolyl cis-trans isomerase shutdown-like [Episyrphus balteatus]|uniref:inactive peptidyl-prolyl cis-trans isomerase shutdown-like n=1 Tax=Episyrphus balteatus TaxID=286459 RepID=UPI0024866A7F|nr:inactive peptidyl-prolyl cis-trans isomerase shutdown-like [Episyrphus balteatus]